jgi:hypothetical protein
MYCNLGFKRLKRNSRLFMLEYVENEEGRDPIDFEARNVDSSLRLLMI